MKMNVVKFFKLSINWILVSISIKFLHRDGRRNWSISFIFFNEEDLIINNG